MGERRQRAGVGDALARADRRGRADRRSRVLVRAAAAPGVGTLAAVIRALVFAGVVSGAAPVLAQVILPGQEDVLAAMLGSGVTLPDGCTFADGQVERAVVRATYRCPSGDVVIELSHRDVPDPRAIRTERFALSVVAGSPP